ncbi:MAG: class I SAM-dependent methyltransferase [Acidobacteriota bacterium]
MFEYQALFDARGAFYNRANRLYPEARAEEARAMLRHLALSAASRWLDTCAGGGYLSARAQAEGLPSARLACDGSLQFLRSSNRAQPACVASGAILPFPDLSFDAAACLAALHHAEDPAAVCRELLRVTRPGGRAALGDVAEGSAASRFLNGFVDRSTGTGHRGRFDSLEALAAFFRGAGGRGIWCERVEIAWRFASREDALRFCRDLFGLEPSTRDSEIRQSLLELGGGPEDGGFRIPWTMHYVSARRE